MPSCGGRECGGDGCGGTCPGHCAVDEVCAAGGACVEWVEVPPGTFQMGVSPGEPSDPVGEDRHEVTLTRGFIMGAEEASRGWVETLLGLELSSPDGCDLECPAEGVSWHSAAAFSAVLSILEGLSPCYECRWGGEAFECSLAGSLDSPYDCDGYRLPTEAEWEHAARAGTTTGTYAGALTWSDTGCDVDHPVLDPIGWFCANSDGMVHPSRQKLPNLFGLYDMLGNLEEHVHDWYGRYPTESAEDPTGTAEGAGRVYRGGDYDSEGLDLRASGRSYADPTIGYLTVGFRLIRTVP